MSVDQILEAIRILPGVLELAPAEGGPYPEIAWGDHFFYYAPDGEVPTNTQPFATIVTKDYPDDTASRLGGGRRRLNLHVGSDAFRELTGFSTKDVGAVDHAQTDVVLPHPVYAALGWVAIVDPAERTSGTALELVRAAYDDAVRRAGRRAEHPSI
jgi:hypothetical protein